MNIKMEAGDLLEQGIDAIVQMRLQEKPKPEVKELDVQFDKEAFAAGLAGIFKEMES